ncbi:aromatic ring-hydroxylating dioxygenase subunit alpha [Aphanothece sacrum]|uniref:Ring-hydroxylating dioxygenase, large terminal subunit n=1 Tax=Aphanothece sacrum FPU1 TaxID=1920663 RepID=A0A401IIF2_APHSA|nr:Rieske 2Fe-2S domain-containing protein [Aphanothece sacrum]GBF81034.1 ring-hydroxylating dioxygenase, large terminal subunit [Aphanothece sacrum FPU1]GBF86244.1 ring-hydroxylating dioxygenase, large terminal subunit [Aphanothece sacrum FPU3]
MLSLLNSLENSSLTAGGINPEFFDPKEVWYPVHYVEDLDKTKPTPFTLLDINLVIWWDEKLNTWQVFEDKCPHRLAPLSQGRINEQGCLECPYHGWAFSGTGQCQIIPQQLPGSQAETSVRASVRAFPIIVRQGLLFVYGGNPENAVKTAVPVVDILEKEPEGWICLNTFRDLPYDAFTLMENVLDSSHLPYTHHLSVGNRKNAAPVELEVIESGKWGFKGVWEEGPRKGTLGRQETTFIAPGLMWHDLTSKQFGRTLTVVYATPIRKGECRIFARFPFKFAAKLPGIFIKLTPRWYSHLGQNGVLEDDQIFLHYQERYLEELGGSANFNKAFYLPTKADLFVSQLRLWVNQYQAEPFPNVSLSLPLSTDSLLERYHSHTKKCASCRTALANLKRVKLGLIILATLIFSLLPLLILILGQEATIWVSLLTLIILIMIGFWWRLGKLERQFYQGREIPPRNL